MALKINDKVRWSSTSNGSTTAKTGTIVHVVPAKGQINTVERHSYGLEGGGLPRDHESYVVHVPGVTGKGKGKWYWPRVSQLVYVV